MKKGWITALYLMGSICCFAEPLNYESYVESWDPQWQSVVENFPPGPDGTSETSYQGVTLNIGFACYNFPGLNGLQFTTSDVTTIVNFVHSRGGLAKISYGGASYAPPCAPNYFISQTSGWPANAQELADGVASVVTDYNLDGVDFDIEDPQPSSSTAQEFANQLITFLQGVRTNLPNAIISITIPGQGWGTYWYYLATGVAAIPGLVNYINFMEYDIWVGANTYKEQIESDFLTYTAPTDEHPPTNYAAGWALPASLLQMGLMPGCDDTGEYLSVEDAEELTEFSKTKQLYGVMTWDLDRDSGAAQTPNCFTYPTNYEYSQAIRQTIAENSEVSRSVHSKVPRNFRYTTNRTFTRKNTPSHGSQ